jgi:holo-[acyl-carrier protein] synthase
MIVGIGNDIFDVGQMKRELDKDSAGLKAEIFTGGEISYCESKRYPERHFAARFAAKEALYKALGTGRLPNMSWLDVEIQREVSGLPSIVLYGATKNTALNLGVSRIFVSMSHSGEWASANVVLESTNEDKDNK